MNINDNFRYLTIGLPEDIRRRADWGDIPGAVRLIDGKLGGDLPEALRASLTARREMLLRMPEDFPYTRDQALEAVRERIPGFSGEEFDSLADAGRIRWVYLDGQPRYFRRFFSSLCVSMPDFARRVQAADPSDAENEGDGSEGANRLDRCIRRMKERGELSFRIRIRASLRLEDRCFVPGMFLRAHLPVPAACEEQTDIELEEIRPASGIPAPADALQRTVCWEGTFRENPEFSVVYSYTRKSRCRDLCGRKGTCGTGRSDLFTGEEAPHIVFTPLVRALADQLAGGIRDPLDKARRFYDYITQNMMYTYMPAYFSLESIPDNCILSGTGDCGVFALLFITLCRCAGIPARWQSGLVAEPNFCGAHDWARFYAEPYGWIPVDPSYGVSAVRTGKEERRRFYFGNLDPYRMTANNAFQAQFTCQKAQWRADPYDNQVGELESADRGMGYGDFVRNKEVLLCRELSI